MVSVFERDRRFLEQLDRLNVRPGTAVCITAASRNALTVDVDGRSIQTVEGLSQGDKLDPLQKSFMEHDAPQCGFCTSGQLMSAKALLSRNPHPTATASAGSASVPGAAHRGAAPCPARGSG